MLLGPKFKKIAEDLRHVWPIFPLERFEQTALTDYLQLELMDRARHIAGALAVCLPSDFPQAAIIIFRSLGAFAAHTEGQGLAPFRYLPYVLYGAKYGRQHFEVAMNLQYELTQRFTA